MRFCFFAVFNVPNEIDKRLVETAYELEIKAVRGFERSNEGGA